MQSSSGSSGHIAETNAEPAFRTLSLPAILAELRALALLALDSGHPMAAAQIAGTADRLEITMLTDRPPRPSFAPV